MKRLLIPILLISSHAIGQITIEAAKDSLVRKYHIGASKYLEHFVGHPGYGAIVILTTDGGAAAFGDGDEGLMLYKLDKTGKLQVEEENFKKGYRVGAAMYCAGQQRKLLHVQLGVWPIRLSWRLRGIVFVNKTGVISWDKQIGSCQLVNNPTVSYRRSVMLSIGRTRIGKSCLRRSSDKKMPISLVNHTLSGLR